jgi:2-iminobutanoate/2-iminopropanoate deaminase
MTTQPSSVRTEGAPPPAGPYSQAIRAGDFVFLAGQVPRTPEGERLGARPFAEQARQTLENLEAVAAAAGGSLRDAVKINVYLRDPAQRAEFDPIYEQYLGDPPPARTTTQSDLPGIAVELDAVLYLPAAG